MAGPRRQGVAKVSMVLRKRRRGQDDDKRTRASLNCAFPGLAQAAIVVHNGGRRPTEAGARVVGADGRRCWRVEVFGRMELWTRDRCRCGQLCGLAGVCVLRKLKGRRLVKRRCGEVGHEFKEQTAKGEQEKLLETETRGTK